jgi:hypothetical protein
MAAAPPQFLSASAALRPKRGMSVIGASVSGSWTKLAIQPPRRRRCPLVAPLRRPPMAPLWPLAGVKADVSNATTHRRAGAYAHPSVWFDVGRLNYSSPFLGFRSDELAEVARGRQQADRNGSLCKCQDCSFPYRIGPRTPLRGPGYAKLIRPDNLMQTAKGQSLSLLADGVGPYVFGRNNHRKCA